MARLSAIHHAALSVTDRDASARWYNAVFGFVELFREEGDERRACVMTFPESGYSVGLVEHRPADGQRFDPARLGLDHLAFSVETREQLDEWAASLSAAGVDHSGVADLPPGAILNLKDPDGISLALFWDK